MSGSNQSAVKSGARSTSFAGLGKLNLAASPVDVQKALVQRLCENSDVFTTMARRHEQPASSTPKRRPDAMECQVWAQSFEAKAVQAIRELQRAEGHAEGAEQGQNALSTKAVSFTVEAMAWQRLATIDARSDADPSIDESNHLWHWLSAPEETPGRIAALASLCLGKAEDRVAQVDASATVDWASPNGPALQEALTTREDHAALFRERMASGEPVESLQDLLSPRKVPLTLKGPKHGSLPEEEQEVEGLRFDLAQNRWVQKDRSWSYQISVEQLLEYQVVNTIDGPEKLTDRLVYAMTDPVTGICAAAREDVKQFIVDVWSSVNAGNGRVTELLSHPIEMTFSTTDGGDKPVSALWTMSLRAEAAWVQAFNDPVFRKTVTTEGERQRQVRRERSEQSRAPLQQLLARYDGVPRRHKRAHGALINMGLANQTVRLLGAENGALPRSKTQLTPQRVREEFSDREHVKMRFLFTDDFELMAIDDEMFNEVVKKYHFPPNHELLSYNRPIAGSGYLTIHQGKIVALEDDTVMLPGKLPDNLPPALDVLELQGFPLDKEKVLASFRVVNWEGFNSALKSNAESLPSITSLEPGQLRNQLLEASHAERPALVAALVRAAVNGSPDKSPEAVRRHAVALVVKALEGFQLINVSQRDFRSGALPSHLNEFQELVIDESLADALVRRAIS